MVEPKRKKEKKDDTKKRVKELERIVQKLKGKRSKRKAVRKTREYRRRVSGDEEAPSRTRFERAQEQIEAQNRQIRERRIGEGFAGLEQLQQQRLFGMAGSSELKMRQTEEIFKRNVEAEKELTKQAQEEQKKAQEAEKKAQQEQKKAEDEAERLKKEIERVKRKFVPKDPKQQRRMARKLAERTREQRLPDETDDEYIGRVGAKVVEQSGSEGSLKEAMMESQVSTSSSSSGSDEAQENIQKGLKQREALRPKVEAPPLGDGGVKPALTKKEEANAKREYARIINKVLKGRNGADKLQQATIEYYQEKFGYDPYERGQTAPDAKIVNKNGTISQRWKEENYRHWSKPYLEGLSSYIQRERVRFLGDAQPVASTSGTKEEEAQPRFQPSMEEFEKTIVPIEEGETQVIPKKPVASTSRDVETQARLPTEQEKKEMELRGKLQMRIVEANSIIGDRERAMEKQRERIEQLEARINALESLEEPTKAQQQEVQTLINKLATESAKREEIMRELEVTRRQRDRLIQERDEMVRLYNTTQQDLETQQRNNKELEDTLELRRKDIMDLQERHRKAEDELQSQAEIFSMERANIQKQRDKSREKLERARELETQLSARIDSLETQLEREASLKPARKQKTREDIKRFMDERDKLQKRIRKIEGELFTSQRIIKRATEFITEGGTEGNQPILTILGGGKLKKPKPAKPEPPPQRVVEQLEQIQSQQSQQSTQEMMTGLPNMDHIEEGIQQHQELNRQVEEQRQQEEQRQRARQLLREQIMRESRVRLTETQVEQKVRELEEFRKEYGL